MQSAFLLFAVSLALPADEQLPDWLTPEQSTAVCEAIENQWRLDLRTAINLEYATRDREGKKNARAQQASLIDGTWEPRPLSIPVADLPKDISRIVADSDHKFVVISIVDSSTVLLQSYRPGRFFDEPIERIWINGIGTTGLTSDTKAVKPDTLAVEMPLRSYETVGGSVDRIRQVRALSEAYLQKLWAKYFAENLKGDRAAEIAAEIRLSVRKSRR